MHYIKQHVVGEAVMLIQHLLISHKITRQHGKFFETGTITKDWWWIQSWNSRKWRKKMDRNWHDTIHECAVTTSNRGEDRSSWSPMVTRIIARKWQTESNRLFEQSLKQPNEIPELGEVMQFNQTKFLLLEAMGSRNFNHRRYHL